ncbi:hypothetical protein AV530_014566 [Patagioenas fasciata monilis]|uniref:Uncharacterized protein n=1 Tax=Patagioenas fasciata monilis TaxID=372326 RepID=A0A1V4KCB9_PATFA|nr:hypothetical protein AV530_014566 [Patagioenas fasciata monilis]
MLRAYPSVNESWCSYNKSLHAKTSALEPLPQVLYLLFSFRVITNLLDQRVLALWTGVCALPPQPAFNTRTNLCTLGGEEKGEAGHFGERNTDMLCHFLGERSSL